MIEISQLTLEEKIKLLIGASAFNSHAIPRLSIPALQYLDGGTGINWEQLMSNWIDADTGTIRAVLHHFNEPELLSEKEQSLRNSFLKKLEENHCPDEQPGCYPSGMLLGATWNPDTVHACGQALGEEALANHVDILLGTPNVNLHRDPLNGRLFEGYSEDPYLVATLAPHLVCGVQESGVLANVKHYAANNLEAYRQGIDEHISERALHELYLPGFEACIEQGEAKTIMTSYNKINGVPSTENSYLIQDLLRNEWGAKDCLVISDWGAVYNQVAAINAGNDIDMPGPKTVDTILDAVKCGELSEEAIDVAVSHMLHAIEQAPVWKDCAIKSNPIHNLDHQQAAYNAVIEGTVMLKNQASTLPISSEARVICIGEDTTHFHDCGDGSARVITNKTSSIADYIPCESYHSVQEIPYDSDCYIIYSVYVQGQEGRDRKNLDLSNKQKDDILDIIQYKNRLSSKLPSSKLHSCKLVLILNVCGPVDLRFCEEEIDAILCIFYPGMEGGHGVADLLTGKANPSGKLPLTFPKRLQDCPTYLSTPSPDWTIYYGEGIYVGYRYYDKKEIAPMYPFGFGLSYTSFELSDITCHGSTSYHMLEPAPYLNVSDITDTTINPLANTLCNPFAKHTNEIIAFHISCKLRNTGNYDGSEVVQLYIQDEESTLDRPIRELKAFKKQFLQASAEETIDFYLPLSAFAAYDPSLHSWAVEPGRFRIYIGTSSRELCEPLEVTISGHSLYDYNPTTPFIQLLENTKDYKRFLQYCEQYDLYENDFQAFAIYAPYFSLNKVLTEVFSWKWESETVASRIKEILQLLRDNNYD